MKTSIFFHETFRISYYHIYIPSPKIWKESERFAKIMSLPVPPLIEVQRFRDTEAQRCRRGVDARVQRCRCSGGCRHRYRGADKGTEVQRCRYGDAVVQSIE